MAGGWFKCTRGLNQVKGVVSGCRAGDGAAAPVCGCDGEDGCNGRVEQLHWLMDDRRRRDGEGDDG